MTANTKIIIPIAAGLVIGAFFTATQPITAQMAVVSSLFVILFAAPSYTAIVRRHGLRLGGGILLLLGLYALVVESSAINTGFPYGNFVYNDVLGQKVLGLTPWTVAFAWPPIILVCYWAARKVADSWWSILSLSALFAMAIDLVLDPAAVALGFWQWDTPGFFYQVPLVNFLGWLLTGLVGAAVLHTILHRKELPTGYAYSGLAILWFWVWVNVFLLHITPAIIGVILVTVSLSFLTSKLLY